MTAPSSLSPSNTNNDVTDLSSADHSGGEPSQGRLSADSNLQSHSDVGTAVRYDYAHGVSKGALHSILRRPMYTWRLMQHWVRILPDDVSIGFLAISVHKIQIRHDV